MGNEDFRKFFFPFHRLVLKSTPQSLFHTDFNEETNAITGSTQQVVDNVTGDIFLKEMVRMDEFHSTGQQTFDECSV
ncbi:hypothetical protein C5167_024542 [Papaver somniferum]|uniref:Uncharacterized protein n=1 Tax=Papaver somniferum TaxID=3469 RepID=A0A4Y7JNX3_PAPSO|nr:hypothetical protein C5167_024542 [Papaver somniferum]